MIISGTIRNAVQLNVLDMQWQQKKAEFGKRPDKPLSQEERMIAKFKEDMKNIQESNEMAEVANKMRSGQELTADELQYLQKKSPELYKEYMQMQSEKEAYRRQLRNCKTEEDVEEVKLQKLGQFAAAAKKIVNNPYIPDAKKKELMERMLMRMTALEEEFQEFKLSGEYRDLPTRQEKVEESRDKVEEVHNQALESGENATETFEEMVEVSEQFDQDMGAQTDIQTDGWDSDKVHVDEVETDKVKTDKVTKVEAQPQIDQRTFLEVYRDFINS